MCVRHINFCFFIIHLRGSTTRVSFERLVLRDGDELLDFDAA